MGSCKWCCCLQVSVVAACKSYHSLLYDLRSHENNALYMITWYLVVFSALAGHFCFEVVYDCSFVIDHLWSAYLSWYILAFECSKENNNYLVKGNLITAITTIFKNHILKSCLLVHLMKFHCLCLLSWTHKRHANESMCWDECTQIRCDFN